MPNPLLHSNMRKELWMLQLAVSLVVADPKELVGRLEMSVLPQRRGLWKGTLNTFLVVEARCEHPWWQGHLGSHTRLLVHSWDFKLSVGILHSC